VRDALPPARGRTTALKVIGVGNAWRSDDRVGLEVARRLKGRVRADVEILEREGEPTALIDAWDGADTVWVVDAVSSGAPAGTVHRLEASEQELPAGLFQTSTHHFGLAEAVELARSVGRLPRELVVFGIEGASFEAGERLSLAVESAADRVATALGEEIAGHQAP
jgi:hydrogenase maturation protease